LDGAFLLLSVTVLVAGAVVVLCNLHLNPVLSGSMRPGIQPGDLAVTAQVPVTSVERGDVIAFYPPDQEVAVLHRVVSVVRREDGIRIVTQGDANDLPDPWGEVRLRGDVASRLVTTVPLIGYVPVWTQGLRGPLLVIAGLLLAFSAVLGLLGSDRRAGRATAKGGTSAESSSAAHVNAIPRGISRRPADAERHTAPQGAK
jgi:signal peptidase I